MLHRQQIQDYSSNHANDRRRRRRKEKRKENKMRSSHHYSFIKVNGESDRQREKLTRMLLIIWYEYKWRWTSVSYSISLSLSLSFPLSPFYGWKLLQKVKRKECRKSQLTSTKYKLPVLEWLELFTWLLMIIHESQSASIIIHTSSCALLLLLQWKLATVYVEKRRSFTWNAIDCLSRRVNLQVNQFNTQHVSIITRVQYFNQVLFFLFLPFSSLN